VAAESISIAERALETIHVSYEVLPHVIDVEEAMKADPPSAVDPNLGRYGDGRASAPEWPNVTGSYRLVTRNVEVGFAEADRVIENRYRVAPVSHAQLEPASCIA
jgi:CO/xanthine dehydrogenase Mo-binding subunit